MNIYGGKNCVQLVHLNLINTMHECFLQFIVADYLLFMGSGRKDTLTRKKSVLIVMNINLVSNWWRCDAHYWIIVFVANVNAIWKYRFVLIISLFVV